MTTNALEEAPINEPHYIEDDDDTGFPEPEEKAEIAAPSDTTELEVEVEDDTPADDQNRAPLPDDIRNGLEEDTEEYSKGVKERIAQMRKAYHDERRAKEASERYAAEAGSVAQQAYNEATNLRGQLSQGAVWAVEQARGRGQLAENMAKQKLKSAIEEGDVDAQTEAQSEISQAQAFQAQVAQMNPNVYQQPQQQVAPQQQPVYAQNQQPQQAPVDTRAQAWADKNSEWFGKDEKMTGLAMGTHQELINEGVSPTSDEYYQRIEKEMSQAFPSKFGGSKQPQTVVAPAGRSPQGRKVTISASEARLAETLGLTKAQYAREKLRMGNV